MIRWIRPIRAGRSPALTILQKWDWFLSRPGLCMLRRKHAHRDLPANAVRVPDLIGLVPRYRGCLLSRHRRGPGPVRTSRKKGKRLLRKIIGRRIMVRRLVRTAAHQRCLGKRVRKVLPRRTTKLTLITLIRSRKVEVGPRKMAGYFAASVIWRRAIARLINRHRLHRRHLSVTSIFSPGAVAN